MIRVTIFCFGVFLPAVVWSKSIDERFAEGVKAFEAGKFEESARIFSELKDKFQIKSPDLLVNLGASEFMRGSTGKAMVCFLMAMKFWPQTRAAQIAALNAQRVRAVLNEKTGGASGFVFGPYHDLGSALFGGVPFRLVFYAFLAFWSFLCIFLGVLRLLARSSAKLWAVVAALVLGTVLTGVSAYGSYKVSKYEIGVVIVEGTPFFERPEALEARHYLPEALELRVLEGVGPLLKVRLSSGEEGYVHEQALGIIGPRVLPK